VTRDTVVLRDIVLTRDTLLRLVLLERPVSVSCFKSDIPRSRPPSITKSYKVGPHNYISSPSTTIETIAELSQQVFCTCIYMSCRSVADHQALIGYSGENGLTRLAHNSFKRKATIIHEVDANDGAYLETHHELIFEWTDLFPPSPKC